MTTEEFKAWLSGFLEGKTWLTKKNIAAIKNKLDSIEVVTKGTVIIQTHEPAPNTTGAPGMLYGQMNISNTTLNESKTL